MRKTGTFDVYTNILIDKDVKWGLWIYFENNIYFAKYSLAPIA